MRIIGGRFGGRTLLAPGGRGTRPTLDRVREALFSILGEITETRVLDLYAGTGAFGLEAVSRGASWAGFVESGKEARQVLRKNIAVLGIERQVVVFKEAVPAVRKALSACSPFDLVFADPPWAIANEAARDVLDCIDGLLSPGARVILGHAAQRPCELPPLSGLELVDRRTWGDSGLTFLARA